MWLSFFLLCYAQFDVHLYFIFQALNEYYLTIIVIELWMILCHMQQSNTHREEHNWTNNGEKWLTFWSCNKAFILIWIRFPKICLHHVAAGEICKTPLKTLKIYFHDYGLEEWNFLFTMTLKSLFKNDLMVSFYWMLNIRVEWQKFKKF